MINKKKKQISLLLLVTFAILNGCKKNYKENTIEQEKTPVVITPSEQKTLTIVGDNIWVRDYPKKGKVVLKLNQGNRCVVLDTSNIDTTRGYIDYWYQIKYKDTIGWVFGSQTNLMTKDSKNTDLFLMQMETFIKALKIRDFRTLNNFIYPDEPVHCLLGTSGSDHLRITITEDLEKTYKNYYDVKGLLDTLSTYKAIKSNLVYSDIPKSGVYKPYLKRGFYYQRLDQVHTGISDREKWQLDNDLITVFDYDLSKEYPKYLVREKEVTFRLFVVFDNMGSDDDPYYEFYFYFRDGRWYLSGIYHPYLS